MSNLPPILLEWLGNMQADVTRYVTFAVGVWLLLWIILAPVLKGRKIRQDVPEARQLVLEFFFSIRSIAVFSTVGLLTFLSDRAGLMAGPAIARSWGPIWSLGQSCPDDHRPRRVVLLDPPPDP